MQTRTKAIALGILFLTVAAILGYQYLLSPIGSGVWQYDYEIVSMTVNGHVFTEKIDAYNIQVDPDGDPVFETGWKGLAPDVYATLSGAYRVDFNGERIAFNYEDPAQVSHNTAEGTVFEYYYDFTLRCGTDADQFANTALGHSHECGSVDADIQLTITMRKSLFTSEVKGEFADAYVIDYETIDLQLDNPDLQFSITPSVSPGARNAQLQITDRDAQADQYICTIHVPFNMQSGLVKSGFPLGTNLEKYDVWITKKVRFTLLLTEPLDIGSQADDLSGGDAPVYTSPVDWNLVLILIGVAVFVLIGFFIWVRFRRS